MLSKENIPIGQDLRNWLIAIAAKIAAALVAAALIPMSFISYYNLRQSLDSVEAGEYRKLELLATSVASRLDQLIIDIQRIVVQVTSDRMKMAEIVRMRDQKLKMQVQELRIEIDETKRANHVADITENEHFQQLQMKIQKLREQAVTVSETETE